MKHVALIWGLAGLFVFIVGSARGELPERLALELEDVRVQTLPASVWDVKRGPGGRAWLMVDPPETWSLAQAKAVVEREFDQSRPQVIGLELLGWGRGGRAWFVPSGWTPEREDDRLLGYDGKGWVETENDAKVVAGPVVLEGYELFAGRSGVKVFSLEGWQTALPLNGSRPAGLMVADPGGTSAVVQFGSDNELYRFRGGRMVQVHDGATLKGDIQGLASCRFGVFGYVDEALVYLAPPADQAGFDALSERLGPMIERLAGVGPGDREAAMQAIFELGPGAIEPLKLRINEADDPELRLMLRRLVLRLEQAQRAEPQPDDPPEPQQELRHNREIKLQRAADGPQSGTSIAGYRLDRISFVHQLERGHVLVGVRSGRDLERGDALRPGLLVIPPQAEPFYIVDERVNNCALQHALLSTPVKPPELILPVSEHVVRLAGHSGARIWRSGSGTQRWEPNPALLLDLQAKTLTPDNSQLLLAEDADGRQYVGHGDWARRVRLSSIDVITPGAPDDRLFIDLPDPIALDTRASGFAGMSRGAAIAMDDDGRLYALARGGPLKVYDGRQWRAIPGTEAAGASRLLLIGRSGAVIYEHADGACLVWDERVEQAASLAALVEEHHALLSDLFRGGSLPMMVPDPGQLIADKAGHIWLRRHHDVRVFDGQRWIADSDERVTKSDEASRFRFMAPVGDGSSIYITNLIQNPPLAYYATIRDGAIHKTEAPHGHPAHPTVRDIRDDDGTLWVTDASGSGPQEQHHAVRIVPGEAPLRIEAKGHPLLHDGRHLVLFQNPQRLPQHRMLNFARGGEVVHALAVPSLSHSSDLSSDKPGSIYASTDRGLAHLTANAPQDHPHDYAVSAFYHIESPGRTRRLYASPKGFLAVVREDGEALSLHLLDLPLKPRPSLVEQLRAEVKHLLDAHTGWGAKEPINALLKDHPPEVQVQALLPFIDYANLHGLTQPGHQVVVRRLGELWEPALPHVLKLLDDEQASRRAAAAAVIDAMRFRNQGMAEKPWIKPTGPKLAALLLNDPSVEVRIEAARALGDFDEHAAPYADVLIAALDDEALRVRQMSLSALRQVGPDAWEAVPRLIKVLDDPGEMRRDAAAEALQHMGAAARDAAPALTRMLADPAVVDGKHDASGALYWISDLATWDADPDTLANAIRHGGEGGPAHVARAFGIDDTAVIVALAESLDVSDEYESYDAAASAKALTRLRPDNPVVLGYLRELAQSGRPYARAWAAAVHADLTDDHAQAVAVLKSALASDDRDERDAAMQAVQLLGPAAGELLAMIQPQTGAKNPWAPLNASGARWALQGRPDEHLAWVVSELGHRTTNDYAYEAAEVLAPLGPMADTHTPGIAAVLDQFVPFAEDNRWHAMVVLSGIGPTEHTRAALPKLISLLDRQREPSAYNRRVAAEALWAITRDADRVATSLADTLDDRGRNYFYTIQALERMGPAAAAAIPRLQQATADPNPYFREAAQNALNAIQAPADPTPPGQQDFERWYQALGDPDPHTAIDAVWRFAEAGEPARDFLTRRTRVLTAEQREQIAQSLKQLTDAIDTPPSPLHPPDHTRTRQALEKHLKTLLDIPGAVNIRPGPSGLTVHFDLSALNYPHHSLQENRRHARAMQALELIHRDPPDAPQPD